MPYFTASPLLVAEPDAKTLLISSTSDSVSLALGCLDPSWSGFQSDFLGLVDLGLAKGFDNQ